jgi:hypothetical protein
MNSSVWFGSGRWLLALAMHSVLDPGLMGLMEIMKIFTHLSRSHFCLLYRLGMEHVENTATNTLLLCTYLFLQECIYQAVCNSCLFLL